MIDQNQFNITKYSQAPLRMEAKAGFSASPEKLFTTISSPHAVASWVPLMLSLSMEYGTAGSGTECGVGSVRHCAMRGMGELNETIVWWNPPHGYAFQVSTKIKMMLPTEDHVSVMFVEPDGNGGSMLTWQHYFNWRGLLMRHMAAVMLPMMMNTALNNIRRELGGAGGKMRRVRQCEASHCQENCCK
ncbi:MAG TPA: SRPBCC family protein [Novimethylophilus sp.]|jgi:hypothetical protein|uniref:SRPBCC family protein n=1 Tax=Novimethylophilus sp. TaxID=2137426 RepID=UPI002F3F79EC